MQPANLNLSDAPVLILAPTGYDARNAADVLAQAEIRGVVCADVTELCQRANEQSGALVIGEEAFNQPALNCLLEYLVRQPPWSDIPVLLLTQPGEMKQRTQNILNFLGERANLTLVEKPLRAVTLVSVVQSSLRSRNRQFEVRDLLENYSQAVEDEQKANALLSDKAAHLEALVQQRTVKLKETIGDLEAFSYSIAHDMRAPLRSLHSFSEILLSDYSAGLEEEPRHLLHRIANAAARMDKLIRDVLNYSRVMRSEFPLETVDIEQLLRDIVDTYPSFAPDKADIFIEGPFPPVLGNEAMLTQIFSNLLGNAVKFVAPGARPHVRVWAELSGRRVRMFVQDDGIGIEADQHEKIFGIFQQGNKQYEGTGIGLAIAKKAIERIGGAIGLWSEPDHGSTFWIDAQLAVPRAMTHELETSAVR